MLTFRSPTRNNKKKAAKSLDTPYLVNLEATVLMVYVNDMEEYKTNVVNLNSVTSLKFILKNIRLSMKKTILKNKHIFEAYKN